MVMGYSVGQHKFNLSWHKVESFKKHDNKTSKKHFCGELHTVQGTFSFK